MYQKRILSVLLITLLLSTCNPIDQDDILNATESANNHQNQNTAVAPLIPSETNVIIPTITPTAKPTLLIEPSTTPTVETLPYPSTDQVYRDLLTCSAPCLYGIIPLQTSETQISQWPSYNQDSYSFSLTKGSLFTEITIKVKEGIVQGVISRNYGMNEPDIKTDDWIGLTPGQVLLKYGAPSKIQFDVEHPHEETTIKNKVLFLMIFLYEGQDFGVFFSGGPIDDAANGYYSLCPGRDAITSVVLWAGEIPGAANDYKFPVLEELSPITNAEFFEGLTGSPQDFCLYLKADALFD